MRKKNIFDILENAESNSMERLIDKCPEISDEQLDKILAMSEKKYKMRKEEMVGKNEDKRIKMTDNGTVEGVEVSRKPAWLSSLSMAASIVLIAGIAIGSTAYLRHVFNGRGSDGGITTPPAVTVSTSKVTGTTYVSTDKNGSTVTTNITNDSVIITTFTEAASTDKPSGTTTTQVTTEAVTETAVDTDFIKPFVGKWIYETSPNNTVHTDGEFAGFVNINADATYLYHTKNGQIITGEITKVIEEIGGTKILNLEFSGDSFVSSRAAYVESAPNELHFGNGDAARLVREAENKVYNDIVIEKINCYNTVETILCKGVAHSNNEFINEGDRTYYKVTDLSEIKSLSDFEALINNNFTGKVRKYFLNQVEGRFVEIDGVLYVDDWETDPILYDTSTGFIITEIDENGFAALNVDNESLRPEYSRNILFIKSDGEWKMSDTEY